jgi:hypothetical protein
MPNAQRHDDAHNRAGCVTVAESARRRIYLPAYRWVLAQCLQRELGELRRLGASDTIVLLDYETNSDFDDLTRPVAHAALIVRYLEGTWPVAKE